MATMTHEGKLRDEILDQLPPIFRAVLVPEPGRLDLGWPWTQDGFVYASDGRIAVRIAAAPELHAAVERSRLERNNREPRRFPVSLAGLFSAGVERRREPTPIPAAKDRPPPIVPCPECDGFGFVIDDPSAPDMAWECGFCDGDKLVHSSEPVPIGPDFLLSAWNAGLLARCYATLYVPVEPGVVVAPGRTTWTPARFVIRTVSGDADVEGLVMPMTPEGAGRRPSEEITAGTHETDR